MAGQASHGHLKPRSSLDPTSKSTASNKPYMQRVSCAESTCCRHSFGFLTPKQSLVISRLVIGIFKVLSADRICD